jgi:hypothetical protein
VLYADSSSTRVQAAESALLQLLRALSGDLLRAVAAHLDDADLSCARLVCKAFRDHSSPAQEMLREDFLRTRALAVFDRALSFLPAARVHLARGA